MNKKRLFLSIQCCFLGAMPLLAVSAMAQDSASPKDFEAVQVTGSRIPRAQVEGPAPITVITAEDISASGFVSVPDVLRSLTQNTGNTQSQQSASGADFSPGAQQVDLRGLGPNHTLVLVNGRRIADFPMPFNGRSNFTDVSNIPLGMIERIEVLTGSASAIYGSDAISGVVNFILKKNAEGTTVNVRYGATHHGGGESYQVDLASGFSRGNFNAVVGLEYLEQKPLWAYQRSIQDSSNDGPTERSRVPRRTFLRTDYYDDYLDPTAETCASLSHLNGGSVQYAYRPNYGYFCGSDKSMGYGTIISERKGLNGYASLSYQFDNGSEWFADIQMGHHRLALFRDVPQWSYMAPDGNEEGYFYNQATDDVEYWGRQFAPEEMGSLENGMVRNTQKTFSLATGFKGTLAEKWDYEAAFSHSQYKARISWLQIVAEKANYLYLGKNLGIDEDSGYDSFYADPNRLYTALTRQEFDSISARSVYNPESKTDTVSFTLSNGELFSLPAGAVGFASVLELGRQSYDLNPDPLATEYYYYSWRDSDGSGSRNRWALATELRAPLTDDLNLSMAARYDQYRFAGRKTGKVTYSTGLEWRPLDTLLVRGSYGTAFRAPDLHYVFAGEGNDETSATDFYRCRSEQSDVDIADCDYSSEALIRTRQGNRDLDPETSTSWTAGMVWSPTPNFDISLDYFDIEMKDQVQDLSTKTILQDEASCRLGKTVGGQAVDINSPSCVDALNRVKRLDDGTLYGLYVNPINVAKEKTSGIDLTTRFRWSTNVGDFRLVGNYTWVRRHTFQQYPGDPVENKFAVNSGFDIPRNKASATLSWERNSWSATLYGERLGRLPNSDSYDEIVDIEAGEKAWISPSYRFNTSIQYQFDKNMRVSLSINNVLDKMPPKDPTYTSYPYYDVNWFDALGRTYNFQFSYQFGAK